MDMNPAAFLTPEDERFLLRLIYFPDMVPPVIEPSVERRLSDAGLTAREFGRIGVTAQGLRFFAKARPSHAAYAMG
jgi:hypothetical protein